MASTKKSVSERENRQKALALRFLKELGFLTEWKKYIRTDICDVNEKNWWKNCKTTRQIFGRLNFTGYLCKRKVLPPNIYITKLYMIFASFFEKDYLPSSEGFTFLDDFHLNLDNERNYLNDRGILDRWKMYSEVCFP